MWFDAQDTSSYNRGTNITYWKNKAYNGGTATVNGGGTYSATTINNYPAINPTAGTGMALSVTYTQRTATCFIVSNTGNLSQNVVYLGSNTFGGLRLFCPSTSSQITMNSSSVGNILITTALPSGYTSSVCLLTATGNSSAQSYGGIYINGTASSTSVGSTNLNSGSVTQYIMWDPSLGASSTSAIGEIIVFDGALSSVQRQQVEGYLAWKWSLNAALPTSHPFYYSRPVNRRFQPIDISGCGLWLDGQDSAYIVTSGTNVLTWTDKSGNNAIGQGVNNPKLNTTSAGFAYGIYFTGTQYFSLTANPAPFTPSLNTVFVCGTGLDSSVGAGGYYYGTNVIGAGPVIVNASASPAGAVTWIGNGASPQQVFSSSLTGGFIASSVTSSASSTTGYFNGTQVFSGGTTTGSSASAINFIGTQAVTTPTNNLGNNGTATIYEIIIYNIALTQYQREQVEAYLGWKWGLRSKLPSTPGSSLNAPGYTLNAYVTRFIPTQYQNCVVWLDGADQSTYNKDSPANWRNKGTNGGTAITSGGAYATTINGVPALNPSLMPSGWNLPVTYTTQYRTIFIVSQPQGSGGTYAYTGTPWNSTTYPPVTTTYIGCWEFYYNNTNKLYSQMSYYQITGPQYNFTAPMYIATTVPSGFFNSPGIISMGNNIGLYLNGAYITPSNATNQSSTANGSAFVGTWTQYFGYSAFSGQICQAAIGEILVFDGIMPISQRQQIEGYLAWKWGLASKLPFYHPFKQIRP